jgi:hypothetical protein
VRKVQGESEYVLKQAAASVEKQERLAAQLAKLSKSLEQTEERIRRSLMEGKVRWILCWLWMRALVLAAVRALGALNSLHHGASLHIVLATVQPCSIQMNKITAQPRTCLAVRCAAGCHV